MQTLNCMFPKVSILVTVYNRERFLSKCLESILASSWSDFEVVVVDDCSYDGSVEIGEFFAAKDSRIRFYRNSANLGDYPNRMRAAELASGKYLKYLDSDDLIYPHGLGVMVGALERYPDAAFALSHSSPEDEQPYPWMLDSAAAWRKQFLGRGCLSCGPSGAIIRRDRFFEVGGFRDWGVLNDIDLWMRLSAKWPVVLLPPALVWWRRHEQQEFTKNDAALFYLEKGFSLAMEALKSAECPLSPEDSDSAIQRARQHHARRLLSQMVKGGGRRMALRGLFHSGLSGVEIIHGLRRYR
jgi:glycosyltransferase involved in cell wall biosynthesis